MFLLFVLLVFEGLICYVLSLHPLRISVVASIIIAVEGVGVIGVVWLYVVCLAERDIVKCDVYSSLPVIVVCSSRLRTCSFVLEQTQARRSTNMFAPTSAPLKTGAANFTVTRKLEDNQMYQRTCSNNFAPLS